MNCPPEFGRLALPVSILLLPFASNNPSVLHALWQRGAAGCFVDKTSLVQSRYWCNHCSWLVSRHFDYEADRYAVELTENPEAEICSLAALYQMTSTATECGEFVELFMTHPALNRRLDAVAGFWPNSGVTETLVAAGLCEAKAEAIHLRILNN